MTSTTYASGDRIAATPEYPGMRLPPTIRQRLSSTTKARVASVSACRQPMVLVIGAHEDIGPVERVTVRVVVGEAALGGQHIPGIVDVEIGEHESQRKVDACHTGSWQLFGDELTLRIECIVLGQFRLGVWSIVRIDSAADFTDRAEIPHLHVADRVLAGVEAHGRFLAVLRWTTSNDFSGR